MDIIRKAVYMGLGAISMTKDKAEELVDDLIKRGEVASAERYKTIDKLLKEADNQEKEKGNRQRRVRRMWLWILFRFG